jgi:hypothetical protein
MLCKYTFIENGWNCSMTTDRVSLLWKWKPCCKKNVGEDGCAPRVTFVYFYMLGFRTLWTHRLFDFLFFLVLGHADLSWKVGVDICCTYAEITEVPCSSIIKVILVCVIVCDCYSLDNCVTMYLIGRSELVVSHILFRKLIQAFLFLD